MITGNLYRGTEGVRKMTRRTKADLEAENERLYEKLEAVQEEINQALHPCSRDDEDDDEEELDEYDDNV